VNPLSPARQITCRTGLALSQAERQWHRTRHYTVEQAGRIVRPSAFAVPTLMTSSKRSGGSIGSSPELAPLRILSARIAAIGKQPALELLLFQLVSELVSAVRMAWTAIAAMTPVSKSPETPIPIASARASACRGTMSP
jgi:hypothetical protein